MARISLLSHVLAASLLAACGSPAAPNPTGRTGPPGSIMALADSSARAPIRTFAYRDRAALQAIADAGLDIHAVDSGRMRIRVKASSNQQAWLEANGLASLAAAEDGPIRQRAFDPAYHTYETLLRDMKALAASHPDICTLSDLGPTWETTKGMASRRVWGLHIRKGDAAARPAVAFVAAQHAREIVTPEIALAVARMLLDGHGKDPGLTSLVEERDIWIVPMVNPDGHARVVRGEDWRKNTDSDTLPGFAGIEAKGPGVDLNRNFPFHWGEEGASTKPDSPTYRGRAAGSEPETQAIIRLLTSRRFTYLMAYHSYSNLIMWPWGYTDAPPPDPRLPAIGRKLGALTGYTPKQSKDLYLSSGGIVDWAFGKLGALAFTTEIGSWNDGFLPPFTRVAELWKENEPAARYLLETAAAPGQ